jgi:hypothetical protein
VHSAKDPAEDSQRQLLVWSAYAVPCLCGAVQESSKEKERSRKRKKGDRRDRSGSSGSSSSSSSSDNDGSTSSGERPSKLPKKGAGPLKMSEYLNS